MNSRTREAYETRASEAEFILYHLNEDVPKIKCLQETFYVRQVIGKGVDDSDSKGSPKRYPKQGVYLDVEFSKAFDGEPDPAVARMLSTFLKCPVVCTTSEHSDEGGYWAFFRVVIPNPFESLLPKKGGAPQSCASAVNVAPKPIPVGKMNSDGVMEYKIGDTTYVDVSKIPFLKSLKYSWSAGTKGASILNDYMRETGKWEAILKANGMYEKDGQVYKGASRGYAPSTPARKPDDEEIDDVTLAAIADMTING